MGERERERSAGIKKKRKRERGKKGKEVFCFYLEGFEQTTSMKAKHKKKEKKRGGRRAGGRLVQETDDQDTTRLPTIYFLFTTSPSAAPTMTDDFRPRLAPTTALVLVDLMGTTAKYCRFCAEYTVVAMTTVLDVSSNDFELRRAEALSVPRGADNVLPSAFNYFSIAPTANDGRDEDAAADEDGRRDDEDGQHQTRSKP